MPTRNTPARFTLSARPEHYATQDFDASSPIKRPARHNLFESPSRIFSNFLITSLLAIAASSRLTADEPSQAVQKHPNVVIVFIDDLGYADIGSFGKTTYPTPNLDRLATQGRRFTDFVVSSAVCSASRAALMTGCYHRRVGISGALGPHASIGLSHEELTIAEMLKSQDYATACFGKWHLGDHPDFLPHRHGFDTYFGLPYSNDMWPLHPGHVMNLARNPNAKSPWPPLPLLSASATDGSVTVVNDNLTGEDQAQLTRQYTEHAVNFIREHASKPFFLYLPHSMVHVPLYVSGRFAGKSGQGLFGDVMMEVDWSVGQLIDTLDELKLSENTLFIFTSDNGPWLSYGNHAGSAEPLREGKGTMFEGGYRVPTIMRWTDPELKHATVPPGTTCDKLCSTIDLLPTIAKLTHANLPPLPIDGKDIEPLLRGDSNAQSPHDYFYCYYGNDELQAIRTERWKLHFPHRYATLNGRPGGREGMPAPYQQHAIGEVLYDLENDVSESRDVASEYPEVVKQLKAAAAIARADLGDTLVPTTGNGTRPPGRIPSTPTEN